MAAPNAEFRFRSVDCPVHGDNVRGRFPRTDTKDAPPVQPPECVACAEAGDVLVSVPAAPYDDVYQKLREALACLAEAEVAIRKAKINVARILGECHVSVDVPGVAPTKET